MTTKQKTEELKEKRDRVNAALDRLNEKPNTYKHKERHIANLEEQIEFLDWKIGKAEKSL